MNDMRLSARLRQLYAGVLFDALTFDLQVAEPFLLDPHIGPVRGQPLECVLAGRAFTCGGEQVSRADEVDDLFRLRMLRDMSPGCIQVIAAGVDDTCAHFGDVSAALAADHGATGAVLDGNTRDVRRLVADGFPVFCRGVTPVDAFGRWQLVRCQQEEALAGAQGRVRIAPGDWIFADADGVLRIRADDVAAAVDAAEERRRSERVVRSRLGHEDPLALYEEVGRW